MMELFSPAGLQAVAAMGWLLLAFLVVCFMMPLLHRITRERAFTVKIAGIELSAQDATQNLTAAIKDLQEKVQKLEETRLAPASASPTAGHAEEATQHVGRRILWVDDYPSNNALIVEKLQDDGFAVDLALSTREGVGLFKRRRYDLVLSDMGRREGSKEIPDAGVQLAREVRALDNNIPMFVFCSSRARDAFGERARNAGANQVTASAIELYRHIEDSMQPK